MLNAETRRRIDACRDILVGKIPNPQAQVEQITLALMYKFMNDMDKEAEDLGGSAQFFSGEYADYSWDRITDKKLGGEERIRLYAAGIEAVNKNPDVPELFREIFKNAYLPYRDPETFNLFAKEISAFRYDHSEDLGDAFEYLLSIMSSQGDAGQFRTPRHIIDFMAEVVEPKLGEKVLDPACGTAGFLIAAYKHIRKSKKNLTPSQMETLHRNVEGYDISPDMVRLSRVNLYLHQFADPQVHEYDTLTDQARWSEKADVILANPPFMSPKGGIRPHKKFGIPSNRSEVLFVDYIMEHLEAKGRAAVIVPEGIIFQSATAYRALRAQLLDGYLWAVASLPAGVFNPYSGVKTSILFLDRKLARPEAPVLFLKIEADGYDLGAQRRENGKNDLVAALSLLRDVRARLSSGTIPADFHGSLDGHSLSHLVVPRALVSAEPDKNLSLERYRPKVAAGPRRWPMVKLGEVCEVVSGQHIDSDDYNDIAEGLPYLTGPADFGAKNPTIGKWTTKPKIMARVGDLLITVKGSGVGKINELHLDNVCISRQLMAIRGDMAKISKDYLYSLLDSKYEYFQAAGSGAAIPGLTRSDIQSLKIPLPPLSVQEEIVAEVKRYQAVIDGARAVTENWRPSFAVDPDWPTVKLGEVCELVRGSSPRPAGDPKYYFGTIPRLMVADLTRDGMYSTPRIDFLTIEGAELSRPMKKEDLVMAVSGQPGLCTILAVDCCIHDGFVGFRKLDQSRLDTKYTYYYLSSMRETHNDQSIGAVFQNLKSDQIRQFEIPLPPLPVQQEIVARIEEERALVKANEKLIELMKKRIEETVARVWE